MNAFNIRRATLDDLDVVAPLFDAYRIFYQQASDLDAARTFLEARMRATESVILFAEGEAHQGLGFTQLYPMFSSVRTCRIWILNDLFVAPAARRQGVAEALMHAAAAYARSTGAANLTLETAADNIEAQALYEKLGYTMSTGFLHYTLDVRSGTQ